MKDFQILIIDSELNQAVLLEDYVFDPNLKDSEKSAVIKFIFDDHHLLLANFWKTINVIIKNRIFSFVPKVHFCENQVQSYLNINADFDPSKNEVMLIHHKISDFVSVFVVPKRLVKLTANIYPGKAVKFFHQSSLLIHGVISKNEIGKKDVVLYIDRFGLHIVVAEDKKLIFYNQYSIRKFDDYLRYIKLAANELNFSLEEDEISLYGYLGKNTPHFDALKKTIQQLTLGNRPKNIYFGYVFDEILDHQYFDVFSTDRLGI